MMKRLTLLLLALTFASQGWGQVRRLFRDSDWRKLAALALLVGIIGIGGWQMQTDRLATKGVTATPPSVVFTNTQMNEYDTFLLNGLSPLTQFQAAQGNTNYATEGLVGGISVPNTSTVFQANGVAGYVSNASATTNTVALYGSARAMVNSAHVWGVNPLVMDNGFAAQMIGAEIDNNITNVATTGAGLTLIGSFTVNPTSYPAMSIARPIGTGAWSSGILIGNNATSSGVGLGIGAFGSGNNVQSQSIQLFGTDSGGVQRTANIYADPNGNVVLAPNVASGNKVQVLTGTLLFPSLTSSTLNPASTGNLNFASGDAIAFRNAANTGDVLIGHNGSDKITFGGTGLVVPAVTVSSTGLTTLGSTVVGSLPSAASNPGAMILVTDSTAVASEGQTCVGSSTNKAVAISNGSSWKCF